MTTRGEGFRNQYSTWQIAVRWLGILFSSLLAGMLAGGVVFLPLHEPLSIALAVTVAAGVLYLGLWIRQQSASAAGMSNSARRWGWFLGLAPLGVMLGVSVLAVVQLYQMGQFPPLNQDRMANFDRLTRAMDAAYPYFDEKGIDWAAMVAEHRPQIEAAQSNDEALAAIAVMLASLNDSHTALFPAPPLIPLAQVAEIEGEMVIASAEPSVRFAGLSVGDRVLAVDGMSVADSIATLPPQVRSGSTPWNRQDGILAYVIALRGSAEEVAVTVESAPGEEHTLILTRTAAEADLRAAADDPFPLVRGERLPSGVGYIHLGRNFANDEGQDMVAQFDAVLAALMDTPGLILDLRDNSGGNSLLANQIAGRFLSEPFAYAREHYRQRLPTRAWWTWSDRTVQPRGERYTAPVALLTDATTVSSAEEFVLSLVDNGRAVTVGRTTAGASGNPMRFRLPGGIVARFSTGDLRRMDGTPVEGVGIAPHIPIAWTLDDVDQGLDPDIAAAETWVLSSRESIKESM